VLAEKIGCHLGFATALEVLEYVCVEIHAPACHLLPSPDQIRPSQSRHKSDLSGSPGSHHLGTG
jgi:hypothetical protein